MDFLDPKKQKRDLIMLIIGYITSSIAVILAAVLLLLLSLGYWFGKNGQVVQNGLAFFSSHPSGAQIYQNGVPVATTGARLQLPSAVYSFSISKNGYRTWQQTVKVEGGTVTRYDYPFLFPTKLTTDNVQPLGSGLNLVTESPDQHWLLTESNASLATFNQYDLSSTASAALAPDPVVLPDGLLSATTGSEQVTLEAWSADSNYLLLKHTFNGGAANEYILLDRATPAASVNLTKSLALPSADQISLINSAYNNYYVYDPAAETISTAALGQTTLTPLLSHVLDFAASGSNTVLYITPVNTTTVQAEFYQSGQTYPIHKLPISSTYLLAVDEYSGNWYAAFGDNAASEVDIYENPAAQYSQSNAHTEVALAALGLTRIDSLYFSPTAQFIVAENGPDFSVYDVDNEVGYNYQLAQPLDAPQTEANWMDGDHLEYVSGGKLIVFDYTGENLQTLMSAEPQYQPAYDSNYQNVYTLNQSTTDSTQTELMNTPLVLP